MFTELVPEIAMRLLHSFRVRNDKVRGQEPWASVEKGCHRERSVAIYWQGDCHAVISARLAMTRTAGKFRVVIANEMTPSNSKL